MAGGVGGGDGDEGARAGIGPEGGGIDGPGAVAEDASVGAYLGSGDLGQDRDERIGRLGREKVVTRLEQEPEPPGIGLAGGGAEADARGIDGGGARGVIGGDGATGAGEPEGMGLVALATRGAEEGGEALARPGEAGLGGIGEGEVLEREAAEAAGLDGEGQGIGREVAGHVSPPGCGGFGEGPRRRRCRRRWRG